MMRCAKFGWNWPGIFGEEVENVKRRADAGEKNDQKSSRVIRSGELKPTTGTSLQVTSART